MIGSLLYRSSLPLIHDKKRSELSKKQVVTLNSTGENRGSVQGNHCQRESANSMGCHV